MSFPKAKIHRFNEDISCAPPPGRYDPKLDTKVKGAALPTSKRFPDQLCNSTSLDNLDKTHASQVTFRTPQVIRRCIPLTPKLRHLREKNFDTPGSDSSLSSTKSYDKVKVGANSNEELSRANYHRLEQELLDLTNKHMCEILERDVELSILKKDLEDIKKHEAELKVILEEKSALAADKKKELLEVKHNLDTVVEKINEERKDHKKYIEVLTAELSQLQIEKEDLKGILKEKQSAIIVINDKCLNLQNELKILKEEKESCEKDIVRIKETNDDLMNELVFKSEQKIEDFEQNLKSKVHNLEQEFDAAQQKAHVDFQTKLNFISHEFNVKTQEVENNMNTSLVRMKNLEKLTDQQTSDLLNSLQEADERCKYIYRELCKVEGQRDDLMIADLEKNLTIIDVQEKCDLFEKELEQCRNKCRKYEITLNTMQQTIKALSARLLESECEVERLNEVETDLETQKKVLEEKSHLLFSDITALRNCMDRMEKDIICDVTVMKENLAAKVDQFKAEAAKEIGLLNDRILEKECTIDMLLNDNDYYKNECERQEECVKDFRYKVKKYKDDIVHLKKDCSKIEDEFTEKLNAQKNLYKILSDKLEQANGVIVELQRLKFNQENQISSLIEKIEKYQIAAGNFEKERDSLKSSNFEQSREIELLKREIQTNHTGIKSNNEKELKQQQYIDELISDLVLEKERCEALEAEKDEIKNLFEIRNNEKCQEIGHITSKLECLKRSLKNAEEKITVIDEEKTFVETQLVEADRRALELEDKILKSEEQCESKVKELQLLLSSAKDRIKTEIPHLEHDNINKAEYILALSMNIDNLTEIISESKTITSCLEAEKSSLAHQLVDASSKISALEATVEEKNIIINNLSHQINIADAKYEESLDQIDKLHNALNKHNEELKINADIGIKLLETEENIAEYQDKILVLETELAHKCNINENLKAENIQQKEELENLRLRLQIVVEERNKLDQELAELMGHQNIHQKIKHVNQLKQSNMELREKVGNLDVENTILKKKLAEFKENSNIHHPDTSPKIIKQKTNKKGISPAVLKDRNQ